ncbi:uncharacterized protein LOC143554163 [Bidens hawaiensis]|uniref:uncharacterized protein LOC143554163 n=1 Tax=Bidens hawaiensis TaxID=980011 RepID=UPI00404A8A02
MELRVEFPSIYWTPCAAYIAERINEDFRRIGWIRDIIDKAKSLLNFILTKDVGINMDDVFMFSNFAAMKEVKRIEARFNSVIQTVQWVDTFTKTDEGARAEKLIRDYRFWKQCDSTLKIHNLVQELRMVVMGDKRPGMGYALAWMHKTKLEIRKLDDNQQLDGDYTDLWRVIDKRWERLRQHALIIVGFMFNPAYFYEAEKDMQALMKSTFVHHLQKINIDKTVETKVLEELKLYFDADGDFGIPIAVRQRRLLPHVTWLETFGCKCPILVKIATSILSLRCSVIQHDPNIIQGNVESDLEFIKMEMRLQERHQDKLEMVSGNDQWFDFDDEDHFRGLEICFP